ncbi:MAG: peptidylprolyl isomerase [Balneolaceae bacterium]
MRSFSFVLSFCTLFLFTQTNTLIAQSKNDKTVIGTVGKQKITYGELKENYNRGLNDVPSLADLEGFLPIYMDYKAKIESAKELGYFNDPELLAEYDQYAKQAAYSYWLEYKIKPTEFEAYYNKADTEVKSEHVLIALNEDAPAQDTLDAFNRIMAARDEFLSGKATMAELNEKYSSTNQGRLMGGDLPWLGVGTTVAPFENAVYALDVGGISMPVRSQFGYHLIHLTDKRTSKAARNVSHIYVRNPGEEGLSKINDAYADLEKDLPWVVVTVDYSEDQLSASKSGNIGWVKYGRNFNTDFVDTIMSIDPSLPYSKPIKTAYGYHIFKIDSVETFKNEEEKRESFMEEFLASPNYKKSNTFIVDWLKRKYNFTQNSEALAKYTRYIVNFDTTSISAVPTPKMANEQAFLFQGHSKTISDLHSYISKNHGGATAQEFRDEWVQLFSNHLVDENIIELAIKEFPGFQSQLDNYKVGLAVYKINDDNVWSGATVDSSALLDIYNKSGDEYSFKERDFYYLLSSTDSTLYDAVNFIKEGNNPDSVRVYYPKVAVLRDSSGIKNEEYTSKLNGLAKGTFSEEFKYKSRNAYLYLQDVLPARKMSFDESFNRLLSEYQPIREDQWLTKLRNKYKMKTNIKKLRQAYNKEH